MKRQDIRNELFNHYPRDFDIRDFGAHMEIAPKRRKLANQFPEERRGLRGGGGVEREGYVRAQWARTSTRAQWARTSTHLAWHLEAAAAALREGVAVPVGGLVGRSQLDSRLACAHEIG